MTIACFRRFAALLVFALLPAALPAADAPARKPNIVFILADDLGYGDVGCYGQKRIRTPNIDRLAAEGMRFTQFYAGSTVCAPSRCCLMTGYHTGHALIRGNAREPLRPQDVTTAEVLKEAGYATALVGKWGLGEEGSTGVPTRQGFDYFYGYLNQHHAHNYYPAYLFKNEKRVPLRNVVPGTGDYGSGVATEKAEYSPDRMIDEALGFLDHAKGGPFFLYFAATLPHANNEAGKKGMEIPEAGIYKETDWPDAQKNHAAMITRLDTDVGRLLDKLKEMGVEKDTLVFFSSDNGPHREGGNNPDFNDSNGPLNGIKRDLTEGGIRVPTIARWPGVVPPGSTSDFIGAFWDVMPTLAELAGVKDKVPAGIDGISFVRVLKGEPMPQERPMYWAFYERGGARAVRLGDWKAVQQPMNTPVRLYNLKDDIGEKKNAAAAHTDVVKKLTAVMDREYTPSASWKLPAAKKD